jgi:hypothetical protein
MNKKCKNTQRKILAKFLDWLIENPEIFTPNKPHLMLADEFLKNDLNNNQNEQKSAE